MKRASGGERIFYGWWIVVVSVVVNMLHVGVAFYSFGRFLPALTQEFGTSTALIAGAGSCYMLLAGLVSPLIGRMTDRYGPKVVIVAGAAIASAAFMLLSLATAVWHLYVLYLSLIHI